MNSDSIFKMSAHVLIRYEVGLDTLFLLNLETDEVWTGNYSAYLFINELDGIKNYSTILYTLKEVFSNYDIDKINEALVGIIEELVNRKFIEQVG